MFFASRPAGADVLCAIEDIEFRKHGINFIDAVRIFDGEIVEWIDRRFAYDEERWSAIGITDRKEVFVVYVEKGEDVRRIISARLATRRERDIYWPKSAGKTDWERLSRMTDEDIRSAIANDPDAPPELTDEFWKRAMVVRVTKKLPMTVRLDADVLKWFRSRGKGYQTRINAVLRSYMQAYRK